MKKHVGGIGIGYRHELASALLATPSRVDFVEVVAEACREPRTRREVMAIAEIWPVVAHGVKLSLGSADGLDDARARDFGRLARDLRSPVVSEHVSFVRGGGREIGHLTELPMTRDAVRVVARNVAALRRHLPEHVPLLLENVARAFVWPEDAHEMTEGDFYHAIVDATRCELLLDVGNLYANALNSGIDPAVHLATFPLDRVAMVHVAGGVMEHGFYFDTHAHPVPDGVFDLVARVLECRPDAAVMIERDAGFEETPALLAEIGRLRAIPRSTSRHAREAISSAPPELEAERVDGSALEKAQAKLAWILTTTAATTEPALARARGVLERKRADDALPLLPTLAGLVLSRDALSLGRIPETPRLSQLTAVADAMRIADAAKDVPELARAATLDAIALRARFAGGATNPEPRGLPWLGREEIDGAAVWAWKGFGRHAPVRMFGGRR